jgi:quercetin dioxygenase-like cupin family protein
MMNLHDPYAEFAEFIIPPGGYSRTKPAAHSGRDYGVVTHGSGTIETGDNTHELAKGDYIAFDGNTPHRVVNNTEKIAHMIWVVIHPERK